MEKKLYRWTFRLERYKNHMAITDGGEPEDYNDEWAKWLDGQSRTMEGDEPIGKIRGYIVRRGWCDVKEV